MPNKTVSPEAAQQKVWKNEIKTIEKNLRKMNRDKVAEFIRSKRHCAEAEKAAIAIRRKHLAYANKLSRSYDREAAQVLRRIAILKGRLGL